MSPYSYVRSERAFFYVFLNVGGGKASALLLAAKQVIEAVFRITVVDGPEKPVLAHAGKADALYSEQIYGFAAFCFVISDTVAIAPRLNADALAVAGAGFFVFCKIRSDGIVVKRKR